MHYTACHSPRWNVREIAFDICTLVSCIATWCVAIDDGMVQCAWTAAILLGIGSGLVIPSFLHLGPYPSESIIQRNVDFAWVWGIACYVIVTMIGHFYCSGAFFEYSHFVIPGLLLEATSIAKIVSMWSDQRMINAVNVKLE